MRMFLWITTAFALLSVVNSDEEAPNTDYQAVVGGNNKFGQLLYKELSKYSGNVLFSPVSVGSLLALIYISSRGNTAQEIQKVLGLPPTEEEISSGYYDLLSSIEGSQGNRIHKGNKLYAKNRLRLNREYQLTAESSFLSEIENLKRKKRTAVKVVNDWVRKKTAGKITNFPGPFNPQLFLLPLSALYFKEKWDYSFKESSMEPRKFYVNKTRAIEIQMVSLKHTFMYSETGDYQALEMDYKDDFSLLVLLPKKRDDIRKLEDSLSNMNWDDFVENLELHIVNATFPKFKIEGRYQLAEHLKKLGLHSLFGPDPELVDIANQPLYASSFGHATYMDVSEGNTEEDTEIIIAQPSATVQFVADHPFLFVVRHEPSGGILLQGRLSTPTYEVAAVILFRRAEGKDFHEAEREVATSVNDFGWKVYNELSETPGNLLLSPLSLDTVLAMTWEGARGRTADELADVLGLPSNAATISRGYQQLMKDLTEGHKKAKVKIANKLFLNSIQIKSAYKDYVKQYFLSEAQELDFSTEEAVNTINKWVRNKTNNKIKKIIDYLGADTAMVMVNALYFKGIWSSPFEEIKNYQGVFKVSDTKRKEVTFMTRSTDFGYAENDDLQFLKMDYEDGFYTLVILPKEVDGLRQLEDVLMNMNWKEIQDTIQPMTVSVEFPKFTIESEFKLIPTLQKMGLTSLFDGEADLAGIADGNLYVNDVVQKTFINFTETGTEAAAVTVAAESKMLTPPIREIAEFKADHPFIFVLRHQGSGANLFIGRVLEP